MKTPQEEYEQAVQQNDLAVVRTFRQLDAMGKLTQEAVKETLEESKMWLRELYKNLLAKQCARTE